MLSALLLASGCGPQNQTEDLVNGIVTLITDYGSSSIDMGVLEGYVLAANPTAKIVVGSASEANVASAAFTVRTLYHSFPKGTVFVCSVAPGVLGKGGARPIVVDYDHRFFVGPDNGIFSYLLDDKEKVAAIYALHDYGGDYPPLLDMINDEVYGTAGGLLSSKTHLAKLGDSSSDAMAFPIVHPKVEAGVLTTQVLYVDQWGNVISNASDAEWTALDAKEGDTLEIRTATGTFTAKVGTDFGSVPEGEKVVFLASDYFAEHLVELAINYGSLATDAGISVGDTLAISKK